MASPMVCAGRHSLSGSGHGMRRRKQERKRQRLPCEVRVGTSSHSGIILDLSPGGLFVQTKATPVSGTHVEIEIQATNSCPGLSVKARVVRQQRIPHHLASLRPPGIGLEITQAPLEYYSLAGVRAGQTAVDPPASETPLAGFRVRVAQQGGPRSKIIMIEAESNEAAEKKALEAVGHNWTVTDVEPV